MTMKKEYTKPEVHTFLIALEVGVLSNYNNSGLENLGTPSDLDWED